MKNKSIHPIIKGFKKFFSVFTFYNLILALDFAILILFDLITTGKNLTISHGLLNWITNHSPFTIYIAVTIYLIGYLMFLFMLALSTPLKPFKLDAYIKKNIRKLQ